MSRVQNPKRRRTVRHFSVLDRLDPCHHGALRELLLTKGVRVKSVQSWLAAVGCDVPYHAVHYYRHHLRAEKQSAEREAARAEREAARALCYASLAVSADRPEFVEGSLVLCELLLFEAMGGGCAPAQVTGKTLRRYARVVDLMISARDDFERYRWEKQPDPRLTAETPQARRVTPPGAPASA